MSKPVFGNLTLESGILRERTSDDSRLLLWLPVREDEKVRHWERIGNVPGAPFCVEQGICAVPANSIPAQQRSQGFLAKLLGWFGRRAESQIWELPNGQTAEQAGPRQTDLLLVWSEDEGSPLEEARILARWPQGKQIQKLGTNLFVVRGVEAPPAPPSLPPGQPAAKAHQQAQELLLAARKAGDRRREASALIDLGVVMFQGGDARAALALLHEALKMARQQGDRGQEIDALLNLGLAYKTAAQLGPALQNLEQALALARLAGDRFAEKQILEHLGSLQASQRDRAKAMALYEQALSLAQALGHRQHEADLLWQLAIQYAELGQRDRAIGRAQVALALWTQLGHPTRQMFADNLERYRCSSGPINWTDAASPDPAQAILVGAGSVAGGGMGASSGLLPLHRQAVTGPALLRLALSVARTLVQKAMVQPVGSGLPTVAPATLEQRLQTCGSCEHHTGARCRLCGCFTSVKTRLLHETCPAGKWPR